MTQFEKLDLLLRECGGTIQTFQVLNNGISKSVFYAYVKERGLEQAAHGVYVSPDTWTDAMYLLEYMKSQFKFAELAKYRKQHKNNQQAGSLITRLPAFFYACKCHFSRGCSNEPPLNTPRGNKVKLYQVQCSNESRSVRVLCESGSEYF